jgi:hypothetical protein
MPCYHPIKGFRTPDGVVFAERSRHDILGDINIACGQCVGCRLERSRQWADRVMHEAATSTSSCFVTLTYDDSHLPPDNSLNHKHFQLFIKRLRKHFHPVKPRFYMCGEYGSQTNRPHYHACLFNVHFPDKIPHAKTSAGSLIYTSAILSKLWPFGHSSIGDLNKQSAAYTARYCMQKITGQMAQYHYSGRTPDYNRMSLRPGIGATWFARYHADVFNRDYVVSNGTPGRPPKYYDKLHKRLDQVAHEATQYGRHIKALPLKSDNTPERLLVKETVAKARIRQLKREI